MSTSDGPSVRPALASETPAVADALARAFHDDPVTCHLLPERDRSARMARFFAIDIEGLSVRGRVLTTDGVEGAALWAAPDRWRMPMSEMARHLPATLHAFGRRLPRALGVLRVVESRHPVDPPHWYLAVLGTDPDHQGRGVGSALVQPVLDECDRDGVGAYLESSKESNIPFYRRHGFEVTEEIHLPDGPTLWGMWRDPRPDR